VATDPHDYRHGLGERVPLGVILVRRGVLTEQQLAAALAEQQRSGEKLGEVLVRLGFAIGPTVGLGLATQHGRVLKTEYGYAVGGIADWRGGDSAPAPLVAAPPVAAPPVTVPSSPEQPPLPKLAPTSAAISTAPPQRQQQQPPLERLEADKVAAEAALDVFRLRCAELQRRISELQAAAENENADAATQSAQLECELQEARVRIAQLEAGSGALPTGSERGEYPLEAHAADRSHLLFAPVSNGYLLFEQDGPPPQPESLLEFFDEDGVSCHFLVAEVGAPPLPGVTLACAYLVEAD
jgi:hypothetical protein